MVYKNQAIFLIFKGKKWQQKTPKATFFELILYSTSGEMLLIKKADDHLFEPQSTKFSPDEVLENAQNF
jgi:hypothetical protein